MAEDRYNLQYTGGQVDQLLAQIGNILASLPTRVSDLDNDAGYITGAAVPTKLSDLDNDSGFVTDASIPTKVSELTNDTGFATMSALQSETSRAQAAEALLATISALTAESSRAQGVEGTLNDLVVEILSKIPTQASDENQLADKNFVNSSIASQTSSLVTNNGEPFTSYQQLSGVTASNNDYAYVVTTTAGGTYYDRYKYNGTVWELEYRINSTVFTDAQWAAINSTITSALVTRLQNLPDGLNNITNQEINEICV